MNICKLEFYYILYMPLITVFYVAQSVDEHVDNYDHMHFLVMYVHLLGEVEVRTHLLGAAQ